MENSTEIILPFGNYLGLRAVSTLPDAPADVDPKLMAVVIAVYPAGGEQQLLPFARKLEYVFDFLWKTPDRDDLNDWIKETPNLVEEKQKIIQMLRGRQLMTFYTPNQYLTMDIARKLILTRTGKPSKTVEKGTLGVFGYLQENTGTILAEAVEAYAAETSQHVNVGLNAISRDLPNLVKNKIIAVNTAASK